MITITETLYKKMPDDIKACFNQLPNPSSEEVRECFPEQKSGAMKKAYEYTNNGYSLGKPTGSTKQIHESNSGNASRFFKSIPFEAEDFKSIIYQAKASKSERNAGCESLEKGNNHPTVKPVNLMKYLIKMITPKGGVVLDPFLGSGTTGVGSVEEGYDFIGIDMEEDSVEIAYLRINNSIEK